MSQEVVEITIDAVAAIIAESGYDICGPDENGIVQVKDLDTELTATLALEGDVVFLSLLCTTVDSSQVTDAIKAQMLDATNGISTSFFQISDAGDGKTAITLSNYAKMQELGADDRDDLEFCLEALFSDVFAASQLLAQL